MAHIRIIHIITGLNTGGAEMMLYKLLCGMNRDAFSAKVVSLTDIGPVGERIKGLGIPVRALGMRPGVPDPRAVWRLARWLRGTGPDVIQTWMYHTDLVGGLAAKLAGDVPVAWGIHHTNLDPKHNKRTTIWTAKACARLSGLLPVRIVCCSEASREVHTGLGYAAGKMVVIPNGFDLTAFKPDPAARESVRRELGVPGDAVLIGLVGRFDPQKDHENFIRAAIGLVNVPNVHFVLCGDGITWDNPQLTNWIKDTGIPGRFHLLGRRDDMPRVTGAFDIASSSSCGEGFPNVLGEAMACGVPCVVTDVGDSALIVGDTGRVVPPRDPDVLAAAWREVIEMGPKGRQCLGDAARRRIQDNFSLPVIVGLYEGLYKRVAQV